MSSEVRPMLARRLPSRRLLGRALAAAFAAFAGLWAGHTLWRSPAEPVVYHRLTFRRGNVGTARFTPDGRSVVFGASWDGAPMDVYSSGLGGPDSRPIGIPGVSLFGVSSTGELALSLPIAGESKRTQDYGGVLARLGQGSGAPKEVAEFVSTADWTPDGQDLVISKVMPQSPIEYPVGKPIYSASDGIARHLRVSPGGSHVAFVLTGSRGPSVRVIDRQGKETATSTSDWRDLWGLAWRPDGREVWFAGTRDQNPKAVYAIDLRGRERLVLSALGGLDVHDVSRDGRLLVEQTHLRRSLFFAAVGRPRERDISWMDDSIAVALSADGGLVLMGGDAEGGGDPRAAYLRRTDGGPATKLADGRPLDLSPDGQWALVATGEPRRLILVPTGSGTAQTVTTEDMILEEEARFAGPSRIWFRASRPGEVRAEYLKDVLGGTPRRVQSDSLFGWEAVSPDGRYVATTSVTKGGTVVRDLDAGEHGDRVVADMGLLAGCRVVGLGVGGDTVYCQDQEGVVYRTEMKTGRREKLFTLFPEDRAGVLGVQSVVAADGHSVAYTVVRKESVLYTVDGVK